MLCRFVHHHLKGPKDEKHSDATLEGEEGQDMVEYALLLALIGLGATAAMTGLATTISTKFTSIGTTLTGTT